MSTQIASFCTSCGQQLVAGNKFCPRCGQSISATSENLAADDRLFCPTCHREVLLDAPGDERCYCPNCGMIDPVSGQYLAEQRRSAIARMNAEEDGRVAKSTNNVKNDVPPEVKRWSWPAFWLMAPWLFAHGLTGWAVAMLVVIPLVIIPFFGTFILVADYIAFFYLCAKGNELAWKRGQFRNLIHFEAREAKWIKAVWTTAFVTFVLAVVVGFFVYMYAAGRAKIESLGPRPTVVYRQ